MINADGIYIHGGESVSVSYAVWNDARSTYYGWCPHCQDWTRSGTEPDAQGYDCPACEQNDVIGAETALMSGAVEVGDHDDDDVNWGSL